MGGWCAAENVCGRVRRSESSRRTRSVEGVMRADFPTQDGAGLVAATDNRAPAAATIRAAGPGVATAPTVAILICTCNDERFPAEQLVSLKWQTFTDWRLVVSDDGSTDASLEILTAFLHCYAISPVEIIRRQADDASANFLCLATTTASSFVTWLYVGDHCAAIRCLLSWRRPDEASNIGASNAHPKLDLHLICDLLDAGKPHPNSRSYREQFTFVTAPPGYDRRYDADAGKIERARGLNPAETFDSGLSKNLRRCLENQEWVARLTSGAYCGWRTRHYDDESIRRKGIYSQEAPERGSIRSPTPCPTSYCPSTTAR